MNKDLYFERVEEFADYIVEKIEEDEDLFVAVVGKFETIKLLLKEIIACEFVDFEDIEIESGAVTGYTDEFVLSLWMNDGVIELGCEKLKRDGEYICPCGDEIYLFEDCSSKVIPLCDGYDLYFVSFEDGCDCDEECGECCNCGCHCDNTEIAKDESSYKINGKPVSKEEFDEKYKEIQSKYEKNIKRMLADYADFMEDTNNMLARLW